MAVVVIITEVMATDEANHAHCVLALITLLSIVLKETRT